MPQPPTIHDSARKKFVCRHNGCNKRFRSKGGCTRQINTRHAQGGASGQKWALLNLKLVIFLLAHVQVFQVLHPPTTFLICLYTTWTQILLFLALALKTTSISATMAIVMILQVLHPHRRKTWL